MRVLSDCDFIEKREMVMKRILFGVACAAHCSGKVKGKARFGRTVTRILVSIVSLPIFTARAEMPEGYRRVWNDDVPMNA